MGNKNLVWGALLIAALGIFWMSRRQAERQVRAVEALNHVKNETLFHPITAPPDYFEHRTFTGELITEYHKPGKYKGANHVGAKNDEETQRLAEQEREREKKAQSASAKIKDRLDKLMSLEPVAPEKIEAFRSELNLYPLPADDQRALSTMAGMRFGDQLRDLFVASRYFPDRPETGALARETVMILASQKDVALKELQQAAKQLPPTASAMRSAAEGYVQLVQSYNLPQPKKPVGK